MSDNLKIITQGLDNLIGQSDKNIALATLMSTMNQLKEIFPLENQECDSLVEIVQQKLQALLDNSTTQHISIDTGTLQLYKQQNDRTKIIKFQVTSNKIQRIVGELLDSEQDKGNTHPQERGNLWDTRHTMRN